MNIARVYCLLRPGYKKWTPLSKYPPCHNTDEKHSDEVFNEMLRSFDDDPNKELTTYTDWPYITLDSFVLL